MNNGIAETILRAYNAAGEPFHPEHQIRMEWKRVHDFQYNYVIFLDDNEVDVGSERELGQIWIAYRQALMRVWW